MNIDTSKANIYAKAVDPEDDSKGFSVYIDMAEGRHIHGHVYKTYGECADKAKSMRRKALLNQGVLCIQPQYWSALQTFEFMALTMASQRQVNYMAKLLGIRHDDAQTRAELSMMTNQGASDFIQYLLGLR